MALLITETIAQVALESQVAIDITTFLHKSLRARLRRMITNKPATENLRHLRHDNSMENALCQRFSFGRIRRASRIGLVYWRSFREDIIQKANNFAFPDLLRGNSYNFMLLYMFGYKNDLVTAGMGMESTCLSAFISENNYARAAEPEQLRNLFSEYQASDLAYMKPDFTEVDIAQQIEAETVATAETEKKPAKKKASPRKRKAREAKSELPVIAPKFDCADTSYETAIDFAANLVSEISTLISLEEKIEGTEETTEAPTVLKLDSSRELVAVATKRGRKSRKNVRSEIILTSDHAVFVNTH
jgi:hypothetical protein